MLNAIQFLVGSRQHVFFCIFLKKILLTQQAKFQIYWKVIYMMKKVVNTTNNA